MAQVVIDHVAGGTDQAGEALSRLDAAGGASIRAGGQYRFQPVSAKRLVDARSVRQVGMDNHESDCTLGEWYGECIRHQPGLFEVAAADSDR
jgi:hypothetical protein